MLSGKKSRKNEVVRGLVLLILHEQGAKSISDLMMELELRGKRFNQTKALGQVLRVMVSKGTIMRTSEYPNPVYQIKFNPPKGGINSK
jgi:hypothetical protein